MDCSNLLHFWQFCKQICSKCIPWQDLGSFKRGKKSILVINTFIVCQPFHTLIPKKLLTSKLQYLKISFHFPSLNGFTKAHNRGFKYILMYLTELLALEKSKLLQTWQ